jgi:tRNA pseudouridine55 synthase
MQSPKKTRLPIHGVLLLDKSAGMSSNDALIKVKRLFNAQKAGHTGTLDPFATGLLPLCFGEATKFSQDLLDADKTYETMVHLGVTTTTGDTEGDVVQNRQADPTIEQIESVLAQLRGEIDQIPPMYSALKRDGKPLYEYARAGVTLEREARRVTIHELEMLDYCAPYLLLRVRCSKGTYIRVLGETIGEQLGCGAHLQSLRRTQVGRLKLEHAATLDALAQMPEEERIGSLAMIDALLSSFPRVLLPAELARRFMQGQRLSTEKEGISLPTDAGRVRVYRLDDERLLGTAQIREFSVLAPERLVAL